MAVNEARSLFCYATGQQCDTPCETGTIIQKVIRNDSYFRWVLRITEQVEGKESERAKRGREAVGIEALQKAQKRHTVLACRRQLPLLQK